MEVIINAYRILVGKPEGNISLVRARRRYLLTSWCRILFEKLIIIQLVKKSYLLYGIRRLIFMLTKARHWTLS
jgi:hypothetical protein